MKTIENVTLYKCDFCKKELKRKHAMEKHEKTCFNNPENHRKCFESCRYLVQRKIELEIGRDNYDTGEPISRIYNGFYCGLKKHFLMPPMVENKDGGKNAKYGYDEKGEEVEQESMPKECAEFDDGFGF
jgi:hypothetical protein